ncbi:MAG: tetratricopeptide repeat protein [Chloroflexi bacterium]|nr:tetratricopeptide repeat protein [Chloroflexota bacterium]
MSLKIDLLGAVKLSKNEIPLTIKGYKPLALLAYLILTRKSHTRQHLVDLLYTKADDPRASLRWTLNQLGKTIGKEYLITSRKSIAFNADADYWLDIDALTNGETAVYQGDLLEGIDIRDGRRFMDWLFFERERLRKRCQTLLKLQLETAEKEKAYTTIIEIGQQLIELDNLQESWYRAVMNAYGQLGNRQAALQIYETCKTTLTAELDLLPDERTTAVYQTVLTGTFVTTAQHSDTTPTKLTLQFPQEMLPQTVTPMNSFVGREPQLKILTQSVAKSVAGQGQLYFIAGDAGSGKSRLMQQFTHQAMTTYPELLIGLGNCNAYSGIGDPYLPFRDILGMLTGDFNNWIASGFLTQTHVQQLWSGLTASIPIILEQTASLLGTILPEQPLQKRIKLAGLDVKSDLSIESRTGANWAETNHSQTWLFQQVTHFLHSLAEKRPLLLFIDDLQWADTTSISLFFHLARRLPYSRILLVAAYRPEELNRNNHHLNKLLTETKRIYGDIVIDLNHLPLHENQQLVDGLLDQIEPAIITDDFRKALFQHTEGHPLFTVELLRAIQTSQESLTEMPPDFEHTLQTLHKWPTRIEAIIEDRINHLPEEIYQILLVASVEGSTFTAQVLASVIGIEERELHAALSQLANKYHLILDRGDLTIGQQLLSRFQFTHILFQHFIYGSISAGEQRLLHGEIAEALESIYQDNKESIIIQLAQQYRQAHLSEKAVYYLQKAGELALSRFANDEAILYFSQALDLLTDIQYERSFNLHQARASIYEIQGNRAAQQQDLNDMQTQARNLDESYRAQALLQQANFALITGAFDEAIQIVEQTVKLATTQQTPQLLAGSHMIWGRAYLQQNNYERAKQHIEYALSLSQHEQFKHVEATSIRSLGMLSERRGEYTAANSYFQQALALHQAADHRRGEASALSNLGEIAYRRGQFDKAITHFNEALQLFKEMGYWQGQGEMMQKLGAVTAVLGHYKRAKSYQRDALTIFKQIGDLIGTGYTLAHLGSIHIQLNNLESAREHCHQAMQYAQEAEHLALQSWVATLLGHTLAKSGKSDRAIERYKAAVTLLETGTELNIALNARAGLATLLLQNHQEVSAQETVTPIIQYLDNHSLDGSNHPFFICLSCIKALFSNQQKQAISLLTATYTQLKMWADQLQSGSDKERFLKGTPSRQEIIALYQAHREDDVT